MSCSDSMEYAACRTGCLEQCGRSQFSPGDMMGDGLMKGNGSVCLNTPTEGCFCPDGSVLMGDECVSKETCSQCVDHHGKTHKVYWFYHLLNITPLWYCYCHHFTKPISLCQSHDPGVCVFQFMESWNPEENPCLLCVCLDQQRINCTVLPCTNAKGKVTMRIHSLSLLLSCTTRLTAPFLEVVSKCVLSWQLSLCYSPRLWTMWGSSGEDWI